MVQARISHSSCLITLINLIIDGMYGNFAGRDASRGMAKQSFDEGIPLGVIITLYPNCITRNVDTHRSSH